MATLKPPTPLLTPNKEALKPASPLHPKNAPKTPISHPQRRRRFQSRLGRRPQRRHRFQSQTDTSEQRRHRFQESGPPGLQDPYAIPVAGGGAWPGFETRHRAKRGCLVSRAAGASGAWNTSGTTSNTINEASRRPLAHQAPLVWRASEGSAAVPVGGGGAWPGFEPTRQATRQRTRRRRCGGRRRDRRARAGFEATRRAKLAARTTRGRAAAHRHTQRPGPPAHGTPVAPDNGYDSETSPRGSRKDRPR